MTILHEKSTYMCEIRDNSESLPNQKLVDHPQIMKSTADNRPSKLLVDDKQTKSVTYSSKHILLPTPKRAPPATPLKSVPASCSAKLQAFYPKPDGSAFNSLNIISKKISRRGSIGQDSQVLEIEQFRRCKETPSTPSRKQPVKFVRPTTSTPFNLGIAKSLSNFAIDALAEDDMDDSPFSHEPQTSPRKTTHYSASRLSSSSFPHSADEINRFHSKLPLNETPFKTSVLNGSGSLTNLGGRTTYPIAISSSSLNSITTSPPTTPDNHSPTFTRAISFASSSPVHEPLNVYSANHPRAHSPLSRRKLNLGTHHETVSPVGSFGAEPMSMDDEMMLIANSESSSDEDTQQDLIYLREDWKVPFALFLDADYFSNYGVESYPDELIEMLREESIIGRMHEDYFSKNYHILDIIGKGSFADVWSAKNIKTGQISAVKKTREPFSGYKDRYYCSVALISFRKRKLEEVRNLWSVCGHSNCINIYNSWEQNGFLYLEMEIVENGSLKELLEKLSLEEIQLSEIHIWSLLHQIGMALMHIHANGLIHLDIKPDNILITSNYNLKLADFGLSLIEDLSSFAGDNEGDKFYIAPEILSRAMYSKSADIFSFGMLLLEVAANIELPDQGDPWLDLRCGRFDRIAGWNESSNINAGAITISPLLKKLIESMLHHDPYQRPTIEEVLHAIPIEFQEKSFSSFQTYFYNVEQ